MWVRSPPESFAHLSVHGHARSMAVIITQSPVSGVPYQKFMNMHIIPESGVYEDCQHNSAGEAILFRSVYRCNSCLGGRLEKAETDVNSISSHHPYNGNYKY